ncbi:amino acid transporter AVT6C-like [Wolffia australiana]
MAPPTSSAGSAQTPLLPTYDAAESVHGSAAVSGAVFNLSTSIIGAGIMSIPATLKVLGVVPALSLILAVAILCDVSVEFLLRYTHSGKVMSYAGIMAESFGKAGAMALQLCVVLTNLGALIMYLIIIGDVLAGNQSEGDGHLGVLEEWFGGQWWNSRPAALLFTLVVVLLPLLLLRRVDSLQYSSAMSVFLAVVFVAISCALAVVALIKGSTMSPRLLPDLSSGTSFYDLFTAVPVIVLAFTFHFNVHPIRAELNKSSDMTKAVRISLVLCSTIYAAVGLSGYLLFGDATMADILSNFDGVAGSGIASLINDLVRLSYGLHLILVYPLLNFSLRINLDGLFFPNSRPLPYDNTRFLCLTVGLAVLVYIAAIVIPNIWTLFQFFGSTSAVCLSLIFPASIVLKDVHGIARRVDKLVAAAMIMLAVVTSGIAISSNVMSYFKGQV